MHLIAATSRPHWTEAPSASTACNRSGPAGVHSIVVAPLNRRLEADLDAGFVDLVDEFGAMVLSVAARIGDPSSAEEISQEAFLRAYRWL